MIDTDEIVDVARGTELLERLVELNAAASAAQAEAAMIAGHLAGSGVCEQVMGIPLELYVALESRVRDTDARFLVTAGEVLEAMPVTAGLLAAGALSWPVAREIIWRVRPFGAAVRGQIDQRIAATVHERGDLDSFDPDKLLWAVDQAVLDARRPASVERSAERARQRAYVAVQADFDGGIRGHFRFDPVMGAVILNALDDAADPVSARDTGDAGREPGSSAASDDPASEDAAGGDDAGGDDALDDGGWRPDTGRGRQLATGFARIAQAWLAGGRSGPAKPAVVTRVDIADVRSNAAGMVELNVRGAVLPTVTAATLEALATDATLRVVLFDGATPLATSAKLALNDPSADTRFAVRTRDQRCRWPGSTDPIGWTDLDHLHARADGGTHHPDNLVSLSRRAHRWKHLYGWKVTIDPHDGAVTITRHGRSYRSLPPGTQLSHPRSTGPPGTTGPPGSGPSGGPRAAPRTRGDPDWVDPTPPGMPF
jgi:hypothetical protein